MRWIVALSVVGCASGSNGRVDALEKRVATLEASAPRQASPAPAPSQPDDAQPLEQKIDAMQAKIDALQAELAKRPAQGPPPSPSRYGQLDPAKHYLVPVDDSPSIGPANAPVTMVAAVQFPEPYTHKVWPTLVDLHGKYPKDLRIVFKIFVVHPNATASSIGACAAGYQRRLDKMEDAIYAAATDNGGRREVDAAEVRELARALRLDLKQYDRDVGTCTAGQTRDTAMFQKLGQSGVPGFWINGRPLSGAQPIESFRAVIDEERAAASADKASGGRPADYYERITGAKPNP